MAQERAVKEEIIDTDISAEMKGSFLEYAYSVIYSRALPDARDGLKPVQRRIVFQMQRMGLTPDKGHVKSSRVIGDVMGKLHPHGDAAIYDALVRLAQPFTMRIPLIDGHGNFGSLDNGPAAPRYTEVRLSKASMFLGADLDEDTVDFVPNYDNQYMQPQVLPAAFPNLLVNGASGIAVGMATNIPPHNLSEVISACVHLLDNPEASLEDLMRFIPGPDFPEGGIIVGLDGIAEAYSGGRGIFRTRARAQVEGISARKRGIVLTELPYLVGPERVIEKIKEGVSSGKIRGISGVSDLSDRHHGMRLVVEIKQGIQPEAVLEQLYKHTPLEESFGINAVSLVDGQPQTLGLKPMLEVFLDHRLEVTRRRSSFRLAKKQERLHLVDGLLVAVLNIDEVIQVIRSSDDSAAAKTRLMDVFDLSEAQSEYILELRLRRLTKFSIIELETEKSQLQAAIAELKAILASEQALKNVVREELEETSLALGTPRRTVLIDEQTSGIVAASQEATAPILGTKRNTATALEVPDDPCRVILTPKGGICRLQDADSVSRTGPRQREDAAASELVTSVRSTIGVITNTGFLVKIHASDAPLIPRLNEGQSFMGSLTVLSLGDFEAGEEAVALVDLDENAPPVALITKGGTIKRVRMELPGTWDRIPVIILEDGDTVVGAGHGGPDSHFVMVSNDAQLLRTSADVVRPQGRAARGVIGMSLRPGSFVISGCIVPEVDISACVVVSVAQASDGLLTPTQTSVKVSPLDRYPAKGRGSQGVRAHRFLKGEDSLALAWVGLAPAHAMSRNDDPIDLPEVDERRDASGTSIGYTITAVG
ncbi:MAG: DNA topoisomerase IV subunit A [Actinomycetaceae bacterium]|nr:DNA topoisomerase IV subunit A [Actinomycetaceae bacterium]